MQGDWASPNTPINAKSLYITSHLDSFPLRRPGQRRAVLDLKEQHAVFDAGGGEGDCDVVWDLVGFEEFAAREAGAGASFFVGRGVGVWHIGRSWGEADRRGAFLEHEL